MSAPTANAAIFISYAREDAVAADRLAGALRSHGFEVWFDQNELAGGDAWDGKIRSQIRTCALLIPVVSANTQGRGEGYFRREWKLAAERTHDMAAGIPFLVPVVIDDTAESAALVPEEFMRVQWTRLPQGRATTQFAAQVKRLLEAPRGAAPEVARAFQPVSPENTDWKVRATPHPPEVGRALRARPYALILAGGLIAVAVLAWIFLRPSPTSHGPAARRSAPPTTTAADTKSLAVLPFENLSAEPDSAEFTDGLHEEVRTAVAKVSALKVIGRSSVLPYAEAKQRDLREIAAKLGVANVVEGTVRRLGNRVRIAVQLIDAQTSRQLWGDSYEKELIDVFAIQAAIAQEIAGALKASLTAGERATIGQQLTQNAEAYRLYLQGVSTMRSLGLPTAAGRARLESAITICNQSLDADPAFVLPHLQLTWLHTMMYWYGELDPAAERARLAEASAENVRRLAPGSPEAHLATGYVLYACRNDWAAALAEFRAVLAERPNETEAVRYEGNALRRLGRWPEALDAFARAATLDPQWLIGTETFVETQVFMRRYADAVRTADDLVRRGTTSAPLLTSRAVAQFALDGDFAAYRRNLQVIRADLQGYLRQAVILQSDLLARDFAGAEAWLQSGGTTQAGLIGVVNNPPSHYRALLAYLQGDASRARSEAADARRYFESRVWTNRQQAVVAAELAMSCALAGDAVEARAALQRSRDLLRQRPDAFVEIELHPHWGATLIVLGDREAALAELRLSVGGAAPVRVVAHVLRLDPLWSRLKDDPRFEEILKSAKAL